jgi:phosphoribosyl-AMP cyclohydrolase
MGNPNLVSGPDFSKSDLIPVIAQDAEDGCVLMLAYMNQDAWQETCSTGRVCYYSRSRDKLWRKGEESGNFQEVKSIYYDCDADTLLVKVTQHGGAACHEGYRSCFFREVDTDSGESRVIAERVFNPDDVYKSNS